MMEYKRLTQWTENGASLVLDNPQNAEEARTQLMEKFKLACNKLAELEDKIENGTLVDTEAYFIVEENQWAGKNKFLVCQNAIQLAVCDFCETREEAEKRLKELQNG